MGNLGRLRVIISLEKYRLSSSGYSIINPARVAMDTHLANKSPVVNPFKLQLCFARQHAPEGHRQGTALNLESRAQTHGDTSTTSQSSADGNRRSHGVDSSGGVLIANHQEQVQEGGDRCLQYFSGDRGNDGGDRLHELRIQSFEDIEVVAFLAGSGKGRPWQSIDIPGLVQLNVRKPKRERPRGLWVRGDEQVRAQGNRSGNSTLPIRSQLPSLLRYSAIEELQGGTTNLSMHDRVFSIHDDLSGGRDHERRNLRSCIGAVRPGRRHRRRQTIVGRRRQFVREIGASVQP